MLKKLDCYDGLCFCGSLVFFAPVALLVRTRAGVTETLFFLLQALISVTIFLGEIPTGMLADRLGYKRTLVLSQLMILLARVLLMLAFFLHSPLLFTMEAVVEGLACCFSSGSADAYLYEVYGAENYLSKCAQAANCSTAGFILSTLTYLLLYRLFDIPGLLITTVLASAGAAALSLRLKKETASAARQPAPPSAAQLLSILRQKEAIALMALSSVFSIAGILINFFYADRLLSCGMDLGWMSPIILLYSLVGMLAKPILSQLAHLHRGKALGLSCTLAALAVIFFALVKGTVPIIGLMVALPLLLDIPSFLLGEQENALIDNFSGGQNRAANLSVLNMGVSLVEILALFASAAISGLDTRLCFLAAGGALLLFGIFYIVKRNI